MGTLLGDAAIGPFHEADEDRRVAELESVYCSSAHDFKEERRGIVQGMSFSPDGKRLASASTDGTVQVYAFCNSYTLLRKMPLCAASHQSSTF